jgi:hypothetical protein
MSQLDIMYFSLPYFFAGALVGVVISAVMSPPTRKTPHVPTPYDNTTYKLDTGCIRVKATEVPCTFETDSLNLLGLQHK